jgi:hypothetical protein
VNCVTRAAEGSIAVQRCLGLLAALLLIASRCDGVILYGTSDPNVNTTAPDGSLAGSGWQYEGSFGGFLGTAIAPNYFVTAKHFGGSVGDAFTLDGVTYTTTAVFGDPSSDLQLWKVSGTLPTYAALYSNTPGSEVNQSLVVFGRGTQRGDPVLVGNPSHLGGWLWGPGDGRERWGTNVVGSVETYAGLGPLLRAPFDSNGGATEAHLSAGDSGVGVFIYNASASRWELAGINYGVDGPFSTSATGSNPFFAAMFDTTGLYEENDPGVWVAARNPSAFYATEIAAHTVFIDSVTGVPEPGTWMAGVLALGAVGYSQLRKRSRAGGDACALPGELLVSRYWLIVNSPTRVSGKMPELRNIGVSPVRRVIG